MSKINYFLFISLCMASCKEYSVDYIIENKTQKNLKVVLAKKNSSIDTNSLSSRSKLIIYSESGSGSSEEYVDGLDRLYMFNQLEIYNSEGDKLKRDPLEFSSWHPFIYENAEIYLWVKDEDFE